MDFQYCLLFSEPIRCSWANSKLKRACNLVTVSLLSAELIGDFNTSLTLLVQSKCILFHTITNYKLFYQLNTDRKFKLLILYLQSILSRYKIGRITKDILDLPSDDGDLRKNTSRGNTKLNFYSRTEKIIRNIKIVRIFIFFAKNSFVEAAQKI